jgi:hypothetical protein
MPIVGAKVNYSISITEDSEGANIQVYGLIHSAIVTMFDNEGFTKYICVFFFKKMNPQSLYKRLAGLVTWGPKKRTHEVTNGV